LEQAEVPQLLLVCPQELQHQFPNHSPILGLIPNQLLLQLAAPHQMDNMVNFGNSDLQVTLQMEETQSFGTQTSTCAHIMTMTFQDAHQFQLALMAVNAEFADQNKYIR